MARILVADDDPGVLKLIQLTLELEGFEVTAVTDGAAALDEIRAGACDLAVLDIMMPMLDGVDVCRAVKADEASAATPVILLSAKAQARDIEIGMAAGADRYMTKPFEPLELVESIQGLLQHV
ncbi:MAG: response regulator [Acidimicrobiia bacterium]|nr:response regulator [Acidimicrobiia bacterium]